MTLSTVIEDTRKAVTGDPAAARALFTAHGTLTGVTEVEVRTACAVPKLVGCSSFGGRWPVRRRTFISPA